MGGIRTTFQPAQQLGQPNLAAPATAKPASTASPRSSDAPHIPRGVHEAAGKAAQVGIARKHIEAVAEYVHSAKVAVVLYGTPHCHEYADDGHPPAPPELQHAVERNFGPLSGLVLADQASTAGGSCDYKAIAATQTEIDNLVKRDETTQFVDVLVPAVEVEKWPESGSPRAPGQSAPVRRQSFTKNGKKCTLSAVPVEDKSGKGNYRILINGEPAKAVAKRYDDGRILSYTGAYYLKAMWPLQRPATGNPDDTPSTANCIAALNHALGRSQNPAIYPAPKDAGDFHPCLVFAPKEIDRKPTGFADVTVAETQEVLDSLTAALNKIASNIEPGAPRERGHSATRVSQMVARQSMPTNS